MPVTTVPGCTIDVLRSASPADTQLQTTTGKGRDTGLGTFVAAERSILTQIKLATLPKEQYLINSKV
jgi:hypothetical protein